MNEIRDVETPENLPTRRSGRFSSTIRGIERVLDDMAYRDAFAKAMSATDAMAADYAGQFEGNSEEREAVIRVFAYVRRSEAEFFRHTYSKLRELFDDELGYLKFKDAPTGKPAEKTVVLWDIDESIVYNDARIKNRTSGRRFFHWWNLYEPCARTSVTEYWRPEGTEDWGYSCPEKSRITHSRI